MTTRRVELGRIAGVFGVQGWLKVQSYTEPAANILKYKPWILIDERGERVIDKPQGRVQGNGITVQLPGIDDRDAAQAMIGARILIDREHLPKAAAGEVYWTDLEGMAVVNAAGVDFGVVSHLFSTPANDVLVTKGDRERMIPWLPGRYVLDVDVDARRIVVDWDETF